jgi:hypothetical protein
MEPMRKGALLRQRDCYFGKYVQRKDLAGQRIGQSAMGLHSGGGLRPAHIQKATVSTVAFGVLSSCWRLIYFQSINLDGMDWQNSRRGE